MKVVEVAAAVLLRPDGRFLLAQRPARTVYAGYWEFPGGKIEPDESPADALARELREELDIEITRAYPWLTRTYTYPHASVRLHFFRVPAWHGEPRGVEGQQLAWQQPEALDVTPMLPANTPVLRALALPAEYAVSNAGSVGAEAFLRVLEHRLATGLRMVQLREPGLAPAAFADLARRAVDLAHRAGGRVLINGPGSIAAQCGADGVHLSASALMRASARPDSALAGASVHSRAELHRAEALGLDFVVIGAVHETPTHPGAAGLGWDGFRHLATGAQIPVYAIGGLRPTELETAWSCGAHGIAMIRGSWSTSA